ncbi:MAG TPA: aminoglycoside phosphotransferase family protein [Ktedonobacterales bacterium]|nr:aminoglycoside phosphotransferase family protein [Ktedonobacterales bacterium]
MPRDFYVQPDAPDPVLPADVVLQLARHYAPGVSAVVRVDESGGEARTYAIDDALILKTQRPQQLRPRTSLEKEVFFLNQLAAHAPDLQVPQVLGYGREEVAVGAHGTASDSVLVEYTLMTRMPGVAMRQATLTGEARQAALFQVGTVLRRIHALPVAPFVASGLFPGDQSFVDTQIRFGNYFNEMADEIHAEQRSWRLPLAPEQVGAKAISSVPRSDDRRALHSNPYLEHVFVDPERGVYNGLIDFGDAYISHPAFDLRRWHRPPDREALLQGYTSEQPVNDAFQSTWRAVMILGNMVTIAHYPERAAEAEEDLLTLLAQI